MLQFSTPLAETDNREQEQLDGTPEESLSEHDEDTPVTDDGSLSVSVSATEEEPSQEPAGPWSYPVRNRRRPNILCYDHLGNPSYHPKITLRNPVTAASVSDYSPWMSTVLYLTSAISHYRVTSLSCASVHSFCTVCVTKHLPVCATNGCSRLNTTRLSEYKT